MKIKVEIKKNDVVTHVGILDSQPEVDAWIEENEAHEAWGKLERWVNPLEEDTTGHIDTRELEIAGVTVTEHLMPKEYVIQQSDISDAWNMTAESNEAKAYLLSTDWYIIRELDSGAACPQDIKDARALARSKVIN